MQVITISDLNRLKIESLLKNMKAKKVVKKAVKKVAKKAVKKMAMKVMKKGY